jgi:sulfur carrier protein ThiS
LSDAIKKPAVRRITIDSPITVAELLLKLRISGDHIVLVDGRQVGADFLLKEHDNVVVLPKIAGG